MANIHSLFQTFNENITLSDAKTTSLRTSRNSLRQDIRDWFKESGKDQPQFCWQGSFAMKTTVNPTTGKDYDIDDGIYLRGYSGQDMSEWPVPATVHNWIKNAVEGRTKATPINKDTCIRVPYANGYHVDLPIYIEKDDAIYLAHKTKGWTTSDPKAFRDWFVEKVKDNGEQLRRMVKYLKAWKDFKGLPIKGIELTILICENFDSFDGRDDKSLKNTIENIITTLENSYKCKKPVVPYEDLFKSHSQTRKSEIISAFKTLKNALIDAINEQDEEAASEKIIAVFGSRFPRGESNKKAEYQRTSSPGVLKHDGRSG